MSYSKSSSGLLSLAVKSLLTNAILVVLLFQYLMGQLRVQAIEMVRKIMWIITMESTRPNNHCSHLFLDWDNTILNLEFLFIESFSCYPWNCGQKHMDPTNIVLAPFDVHRLAVYVTVVSVASGLLAVAKGVSFASLCIQWMSASGVFWAVAVVCGASPTNHILHTGLASLYVATLAVVLTASSTTATATSPKQAWWQSRLCLPLPPTTMSTHDIPTPQTTQNLMIDQFNEEFLACCQMHMTLFVTIPFQVLRLYDWGSQIQRYPLPIMLGSTYGFVLGTIMGLCATVAMHCSPKLREGYKNWVLQSSGMVSNEKRRE
jgi:hypothetical protein